MSFQDHFSTVAGGYAAARPRYPEALFDLLAALAPGRALAWDAGSGSGQAAVGLAERFARVLASDPSREQLARAPAHPKIAWVLGAERVAELAPASVDLVLAAQAAHWFDRAAFYAEARRVLRPRGAVALVGYGFCRVDPAVDRILDVFYSETVGPYWPPERVLVDDRYRSLDFPFAEVPFPEIAIEHHWTLDDLLAYLRTWSAVTRYREAHGSDPVAALAPALAAAFGDPEERRRILWPLFARLGKLD